MIKSDLNVNNTYVDASSMHIITFYVPLEGHDLIKLGDLQTILVNGLMKSFSMLFFPS
jgi:hypothetical protein